VAAGLTVIALLGAFLSEANEVLAARGLELLQGFDVTDPLVFFGLIVGSAVPAVFSALLMLGVKPQCGTHGRGDPQTVRNDAGH